MVMLGVLDEVYITSTCVGCVYLWFSMASGHHGHHGSGHAAHQGGAGHAKLSVGHGHAALQQGAGHAGGHAAGQHGSGHGSGHAAGQHGGANGAGHAAGQHSGGQSAPHHGGSDAQSHGQSLQGNACDRSLLPGENLARQSTSIKYHIPGQEADSLIELFFEFFNPMALSILLTYFGITGLILHYILPALGLWSLAPAAIAGYGASRLFVAVLHWMFSHMDVSSEAKEENMVGIEANVSIPISAERAGEITYVIESKRFNATARPHSPEQEFARGAKVMICDVREHVAYVEPWTELYELPS